MLEQGEGKNKALKISGLLEFSETFEMCMTA